jgi:micrococcal nuclease
LRRKNSSPLNRLIFLLIVVVLLVLSIIIKEQLRKPETVPPKKAAAVKILDGDTFEEATGRKVRLLGIDAPESGEPFSDEATEELRRLLTGKQLRLEPGADSTDRYGRLLAFVFADDSIFVNVRLLQEGLARTYFFEENMGHSPYADRLCQAQRFAIRAKLGIWTSPPPKPESRYFGNPHTMRFHRPDCSGVTQTDTAKLVRTGDRNALLEQCYSPCRNCKP